MKERITEAMLNGHIVMPIIRDLEGRTLLGLYGPEVNKQIEAMFNAMWNAYLAKGPDTPVSLPYWAKRIKHPKAMNIALKILSKSGWITVSTKPNNNWSEAWINESKLVTYIPKEQLDHIRMYNKFNKYKLKFHNLDQDFGANRMKVGKNFYTTDYSCNGFAKAGKVSFQYDVNAIAKNLDVVISEVNKGIEKMIEQYPQIIEDHANYKEIGQEVVESLMYQNGIYNSGPRTSDPRHRNNAGYLNKIANPVGFKVMRGLLTIPVEYRNVCTPAGLENKYLFIAELVGFKSGSKQAKVQVGRSAYYNGTLIDCEVENIWLRRLYQDINNAFDGKYEASRYQRLIKIEEYRAGSKWHKARVASLIEELAGLEARIIKESTYKWEVPIEIDMSASCIGYMGLLLNHKPFLDRCNITQGDLSDAWGHKVVTNRDQFKAVIMRKCYGSQQSPKAICDDFNKGKEPTDKGFIHYTDEDLKIMTKELEEGEFAVANAFKDFIIDNCRMQPVMELNVLGDKVTTYCNRFHNVGETTYIFDLYDSKTDAVRRIHNTETKRVPDLKSFKRYSITGLIHGCDGRVIDNSTDAVIDMYGWCIPIHDAKVLCCESADYARDVYANGRTPEEPSLKYIHTHRNKILSDYFTSLNIPASRIADWKANVVPLVQPLEEELDINPMVLK